MDIYQSAHWRGKYPQLDTDSEVSIHQRKLIWMISLLVTDASQDVDYE